MANTIKLKRGSGSDPGASDLSVGEVALRTDNGTLFTKNDAGNITEIGASSGVADGDKGDITVSSSGSTWTIDSGATQVANKLPLAGGTLTGALNFNDVYTSLSEGSTNTLRITTDSGYVDIGPKNTSWCHFHTDRTSFYFAQKVSWNGNILPYGDSTHDIGSNGSRWANIYGDNIYGSGANLTSLPAAQLSGAIANGVTATTQSASDNSTKVATTAYTDTAISNLVDSSPSALNTLNELAAALGDDANFSTTVTNSIATKLPLAGGTLTGTLTARDINPDGDNTRNIGNGTNNYASIWASTRFRGNDGVKLVLGSSQDLIIHHSSNANIIEAPTNHSISINTGTGDNADKTSIHCVANGGAVDLRFADSAKLTTSNTGVTVSGTCTATTFSGSGASLTNVNATTLDGIDSAEFLRSNAADSMSARLTLNQDNDNEKLVLAGTGDPLIRFQEGTTNKAYIQWNANGFLGIYNQEDSSSLLIKDDITFSVDGSTYHSIYHEGNLSVGDGGLTQNNFTNTLKSKLDGIEASATADQTAAEILTAIKTVDGAGSGLDSDLWDGNQFSSYLNQAVLTTSQPTFGNLYSNDWFRNNGSGEGLYNQANDAHFYNASDNYWHLNGNSGDITHGALILYDRYNSAAGNSTGRKGYIYWDSSGFGLLDNTGNWLIKGDGSNTHLERGSLNITGQVNASNNIICSNWFYNNGSGEGLYNSATTQHFYSHNDDYWNIAGGTSANGIIFRDEHGGTIRGYVYANNSSQVGFLNANGDWAFCVNGSTNVISYFDFIPSTNNSKDLGSSSNRWRNIYTNDLNLSNEGGSNDVDGTWGSFTIQEGSDDLFLINKRNGKKYKFNLTEVN